MASMKKNIREEQYVASFVVAFVFVCLFGRLFICLFDLLFFCQLQVQVRLMCV